MTRNCFSIIFIGISTLNNATYCKSTFLSDKMGMERRKSKDPRGRIPEYRELGNEIGVKLDK